jgi:hypothetical protein
MKGSKHRISSGDTVDCDVLHFHSEEVESMLVADVKREVKRLTPTPTLLPESRLNMDPAGRKSISKQEQRR